MSWEDFRFLLAIERGGGVAGAARELGVDKATVRRRVGALEEELGQPLVERRASGWTVNEAGTRVAAAAATMDEAVSAVRRELAAAAGSAVVRVTAPAWFARGVITPELGALRERHPGVTLLVLATDALLDVAQREADIAIRNVKPEGDGLAFRRVGFLGSAAYASRAYVAERGVPRGRADWSGHCLLAFDEVVAHNPALRWIAETGAPVVFRASDPLVLLEATLGGLGIAVLPCILADAEPDLVRVGDQIGRQAIFTCLPEELRRHPPVRLVADWIADLFVQKRAELAGDTRSS